MRRLLLAILLLLAARAYATNPLVGFVPGVGVSWDVAVNAGTQRAYVATAAFGLSIVDISDPAAPVVVGATNPPFSGNRVAFSGSLAVVVSNSLGLTVVDVSTDTPSILGTLVVAGSSFQKVAMLGNYAYVLRSTSGGSLLSVIDLTVPATPTIVGNASIAGMGNVRVVGTRAYVAATSAGLQIFDVTTPATPTLLTTTDTPGSARDLGVAGNYAYIADQSSVQIINISLPTPAIVGSTPVICLLADVNAGGTRMFIEDGGNFKAVDVSNPAAPVVLGTYIDNSVKGYAISGNYAYLGSTAAVPGNGGLYVLDVSPNTPVQVGHVDSRFDNTGIGASGNDAALAGGSAGSRSFSVAVPTAPELLGALTQLSTSFQRVFVSNQYAYALAGISGNPGLIKLYVIDLHTPSTPSIVGELVINGVGGLRVVGTTAYLAVTTAGLELVDVSNPFAPSPISITDTPGSARDVTVNGRYAYVADSTAVLVMDLANPAAPHIVGTVPVLAQRITNVGTHIYASDNSVVRVILANNPAAPTLASTTSNAGDDVTAYGSRVFLSIATADHSGGVTVYDAITPSAPSLLQLITVPGLTRTLTAVSDGTVYAGDGDALVDVIKFTDGAPANLCTCQGDADKNGFVNATDYGAVQVHFGQVANATSGLGDADCNGFINATDFAVVKSNFGTACP